MGTNYYTHKDCCDKCGRGVDGLHIGKSSAGWCFSLHVIPEQGINNLGDWKAIFFNPNITIKDEYERFVDKHEMLDIIKNRHGESLDVPWGYETWEEFHKQNHSEPGPNNLVRSRVDNRHCVGHGPGTYDYITGEFS